MGGAPAERVAGGRHATERWERQVSGEHRLARRRQLSQETDPDADRLLGIVVEAVVPVRTVEMVREHGIAQERQPLAAGRQAYDAVPWGVATGAKGDHSRRHLVLRIEQPQLAAVLVKELFGG